MTGALLPAASAWFSIGLVPFTIAVLECVLCCPTASAMFDAWLTGSMSCINDSPGRVVSSEMTGVGLRFVTEATSPSVWLFEESPLRKGINDERFRSFFAFSAEGIGGGIGVAAFFLLPITVPRRLLTPCFLGVSLSPEI